MGNLPIGDVGNSSPLVSRNVSVLDISAVNLIVGWWLFPCSIHCGTLSLLTFQIENVLSIYLFQASGLRALRYY